MWIKNKVNSMIEKYSTNDPFEIADNKNIIVHLHPLHTEIMGYYKYIRRNKFIVINSNLDDGHKLFTCAHELGHSQLHPQIDTPFLKRNTLFLKNRIEIEANRFAVELLLPDKALYDYRDTFLTLEQIAESYGVPREVSHLKKFKL